MTVDVGIVLPTLAEPDASPGDIAAAARHAEQLGFESVWVVDQLIAGTGVPLLDSLMSLAAASAVTERVRLGLGVLILPLRPVVWVAKQVATLQHLSGDRVLLGVGVGGDRHDRSWSAVGIPAGERGRRTDEALAVLPDLIAGRPVRVGSADVQLNPGTSVPPIIVAGSSDAALRRAARHGDGWFPIGSHAQIAEQRRRLSVLTAERGRPTPSLTTSSIVAIHGDPRLPDRATLIRSVVDPDGRFGIPPEYAENAVLSGDIDTVAGHLEDAAVHGSARVVVTFAAGDWFRQAELLAEARRHAASHS
ncbi:MAG: LLM class flavin-dependent oxidoreductase [Mycobacteriaceae bacterium]|nr:LLM class flavin-dependent oxidoreductase [Mycobacteriaceae bacterium]